MSTSTPDRAYPKFDALRTCMLGLVLVNLLFVQLTDAAQVGWLLPLYGLTLLAPLLTPLRKWLAYRLAWNLAVVALFTVLVGHAAGHDLRFVLQDGLLLAALCQVHLLNNLSREQRPDLLFLNSFLIAVATGYLCQDLAYPIAFLAYVPLFVVGLQLMSVSRDGHALEPRVTGRIVRDGLRRSALLMALTMAVFLFWPRDFQRSSLFIGEFDFTSSGGPLEVAFSDELTLKRSGEVQVSDRVVMSATLVEGDAHSIPSLWRGATLDTTDGREWWSSASGDFAVAPSAEDEWIERGAHLARATAGERCDTRFSVELNDLQSGRLFAPLLAERLAPGTGIHLDRIRPGAGGILAYDDRSGARTAARFEIALSTTRGMRQVPEWTTALRARFIALPVASRLRGARSLADRLASEIPTGATQSQVVAEFSDYLERNHAYLAPGAPGAAETLDEFLGAGAGGHCELFASALATMLRARRIPCRVVTGYRSEEWDPQTGVLTFRSRGAHAWVEVHDPQNGWYSVDPNPAAAGSEGPGLWARTRVAFAELWGRLTSFDSEGRSGVLAWLRAAPRRSWSWALQNPGSTLMVGLALGLWIAFLRMGRGRRAAPDLSIYRRALKRAGLRTLPGETPRELLQRARGLDLAGPRWAALHAATVAHERARYARSPAA